MGERGITDPFPKGCLGSERCRIPAILTTPRGTLVAASDARWAHGQDTAGNLETMVGSSSIILRMWWTAPRGVYTVQGSLIRCWDVTERALCICWQT